MSFKIIGTGRALPKFILTNEQISTFLDTDDEWIKTRTGISKRHIVTDESLKDIASESAKKALLMAKIDAKELDLVICTTLGGELLMPSLACLIQKDIGANCPAFDVNVACSGFVYALDIAAAYFESGRAKNILIVSAEILSNFVNWEDRSTCILFGDGAASAVLTKGDGLLSIRLTADGNDKQITTAGAIGNSPFRTIDNEYPFLKMNGGEIFKFAVNAIYNDVITVLEIAGITIEEVKKVIPHQANARIIKAAATKLGIDDDKMMCRVEDYGNTSSATIPIVLSELFENNELAKGDIIVLTAFGGGLTTGACVIKI